MMVHEIALYSSPKPVHVSKLVGKGTKFRGVYGSDEHKKFIFRRAIASNTFSKGDDVYYKKKVGRILDFIDLEEFGKLEWDALKPKFIEVYMYDASEFILCHPSDLRIKK